MTPLSVIVAASQNDVIGNNNQLPWHLPRDLAYFKKITMGCPIIMGRKTYESISKALPGRLNIVITRNRDYCQNDVLVVNSLDDAIAEAQQKQPDAKEIHIIGGATIFVQALSVANKMYLNRVLADCDGDAKLPEIDWSQWDLLSREHHPADEKNNFAIDFEVYEKTER